MMEFYVIAYETLGSKEKGGSRGMGGQILLGGGVKARNALITSDIPRM